jgi:fatty-acid desaturase
MLSNILKNSKIDLYIPVIHQLLGIVASVWCFYSFGILALMIPVLALLYHFFAISLTGHMIISHGRNSKYIPEFLLYTLFFYTTFIPPGLWAAYHLQHHKYADTEKDPHSPDHKGSIILLALWDPTLVDKRTYVKHRRNSLSNFYEKNYYLLLAVPLLALLLFPYQWVLMLWAAPAGLALSLGTYSAFYSHKEGVPSKYFSSIHKILFLGEIGDHASHHKNWNNNSSALGWFHD